MAKNLPELGLLLKDISDIESEELLNVESANNKPRCVNNILMKKQLRPHFIELFDR